MDAHFDPNEPFVTWTAELRRFIEKIGRHYQNEYALPRIAGRIMALLMAASRPATPEEIASALQISLSSISTNLRRLTTLGVVEKDSLPGQRADYYRFSPHAWENILNARVHSLGKLDEFAALALEQLHPEGPFQQRLVEVRDWSGLIFETYRSLLEEWRKRPAG